MSIEQAASFMTVSILFSVALIVLVACACAINYLINRFWKPVRVFTQDSFWVFGRHHDEQWIENHPEVIAAKQKELDKSKEPVLK
jgi:hypothetical protein